MNVLSLGKGAAYRRLSGEVPFSFEDVARISRKFGISLDKIVGESNSKDIEDNQWLYMNKYVTFIPFSQIHGTV